MSTGKIIGLVGGIAAIVIVVLVIGSIASTVSTVATENQAYCHSRFLQLDEQKSSLSREWIQTPNEVDTLNAQVDAYNAECAS